MKPTWRSVHLGDVAEEVTVGFVGKMSPHYVREGIPFLRSQDVRPFRIDLNEPLQIDPEFHERISKSALRSGDVVTVRTGKPGATAVVPEGISEMNCADLLITRPGPEIDARWLCAFINVAAAHHVISHLVGAVQQHFNVGAMKRLPLLMPSLSEQRAIAEVLGALDDKIAANDRLIQECDELRKLIFERGLEPASACPLTDLADFVNGRNFTKDASGSGRPVIRIAELNSGLGGSTVFNDLIVPDCHVARPGDLLFAWSGSLTLRRWHLDEGIVNQHIFKVLPKADWPLWLVASVLERKMDEFKAIAADKATTMGHIQRRHLDEPVDVPAGPWIGATGGRMAALWDRALASELESQRLADLRDALLPELMSGRMRVKDAVREAEEVL